MPDRYSEQRIQDNYELGCRAGTLTKGGNTYGKATIGNLAFDENESKVTVYNAQTFAKLYSRPDLESMLRMRKRFNAENFGWGHIIELLTVKDRKTRLRLQKAAIMEGWTVLELKQEVRKERELVPA